MVLKRRLFAVVAALAGAAGAPAVAQEVGRPLDVMSAIEGVWAYDADEVEAPGDFTCADRPIAFEIIDGGARVVSKRVDDAAVRYGLILDVRNDFPLGAALSIVWEDAPTDASGDPRTVVLIMESDDRFSWILGEDLIAYQRGAETLERSQRRIRCALGAA